MQLVAFVINYILKFLFVNTFALKKTDFFSFLCLFTFSMVLVSFFHLFCVWNLMLDGSVLYFHVIL